MDDSQLRRAWENRQHHNRVAALCEPMGRLMNSQLAKRVKQIGQLAAAWDECIPEFIREHTAIVKYVRGVLTVAVDSSAHRYQLQNLLQCGLLVAIRERFGSGALNSVKLVPGDFDALDFPDRPARQQSARHQQDWN